jgi:ABC-type transporter Mla subunit MlaD
MKATELDQITGAIRQLADAITPTHAAGSTDASGGFVSSHTEAIMGLTASMQAIASSIGELADAIKESR